MQKLLTDTFLRSIAAPPRGRIEYADLRGGGLAFRITSRGARSWSFRFRDPATGKVGRATIGGYPDVGLSAARGAANDMRRAVAKGSNPRRYEAAATPGRYLQIVRGACRALRGGDQ